MKPYEQNLTQISKIMNIIILIHIPIFYAMAVFFKTEVSLAIAGPLVLVIGQLFISKILKNIKLASVMMGFTMMAMSALMIHLGKGMIEWHFHIFVFIGILCLFANPWTIIAAAASAAVHHLSFYFFLPESIFNYEANIWIVVIHALFVVAESIACVFLAIRFKKVLMMQEKMSLDIEPLVTSIDDISKNSSESCVSLLDLSNSNSSSITEISSTAEEISKMVEKTLNQIDSSITRMEKTQKAVQDSDVEIERGKDFLNMLNNIKSNMDRIQTESSEKLGKVEESVNTISSKTTIINDIVFQTKLLSFNASVEAARAGEHGKGFSVVAEEIGNLASTSGSASEEISSIVALSKEQLNSSIQEISSNISAFQKDIENAFDTWNQINNKLSSSFTQVRNTSKEQEISLKEISSAADQQNIGVKELSVALTQIDQSTHKSLHKLKEVQVMSSKLEDDTKKLSTLQKMLTKN
jgi:methyl-accepting chemotaxis protein